MVDGERIRNRFNVKLVPESLGHMAATELLESCFLLEQTELSGEIQTLRAHFCFLP